MDFFSFNSQYKTYAIQRFMILCCYKFRGLKSPSWGRRANCAGHSASYFKRFQLMPFLQIRKSVTLEVIWQNSTSYHLTKTVPKAFFSTIFQMVFKRKFSISTRNQEKPTPKKLSFIFFTISRVLILLITKSPASEMFLFQRV